MPRDWQLKILSRPELLLRDSREDSIEDSIDHVICILERNAQASHCEGRQLLCKWAEIHRILLGSNKSVRTKFRFRGLQAPDVPKPVTVMVVKCDLSRGHNARRTHLREKLPRPRNSTKDDGRWQRPLQADLPPHPPDNLAVECSMVNRRFLWDDNRMGTFE